MSWKVFKEKSPELARLSYERLNQKIAYLAILKKDGTPQLHPVTPFIDDEMLFIFTEPSSPKIRNLQRNGRYALHCSVGGEGPLIEVLISGEARVISDTKIREKAMIVAGSPIILASYYLFEFLIQQVLVVTYDENRKPVVQHWRKSRALFR